MAKNVISEPEQRSEDRSVVKTLHKGLQLLDLVAETSRPLSLTEIAQRFSTDLGTVHRFLNTLVKEKYVFQDPATKRYSLGAKVLSLSRMFFTQQRIFDLSKEEMLELSATCEETAQLSVLSGIPSAVLVDEVMGEQLSNFSMRVGTQLPMHCTSHGKVLLAYQSDSIVEKLLPKIDFQKYTAHTLTDPEKLRAEIREIRKKGYAQADEEFIEAIHSIAAPIHNYQGQAVAAIGISCPNSRYTKKRLEQLAQPVCEIAQKISHKMGFDPQASPLPIPS